MSTMMLLYENFGDQGVLSGGSWLSSLPITNIQDPRPTKRARSSDLASTSTQWKIALPESKTLRALVFGPTNGTEAMTYKISWYSDAAFTSLVSTTGFVSVGTARVASLSLHWEDRNFWTGRVPRDDPDQAGITIIAVLSANVTARYWKIELVDATNPAGYLEVGRAFMGTCFIPTYNFAPSSNKFGFVSNTGVQKALGGTKYFNRHKSARQFTFAFPNSPSSEIWSDIYRIQSIANLDQQVFVIPNPADSTNMNKQAFLGTLEQLPDWSLFNMGSSGGASTAFTVTEAL